MAKGPGSEKSLQQKTAQIASKGTAREAYLKAISEDRRFSCFRHPGRRSPSLGRGHRSRRDALHPGAATDERHRNGAGAEQDRSGFHGSQHWTLGQPWYSPQASAIHSISMSNSIGQDPTGTKVREGGFSAKYRA